MDNEYKWYPCPNCGKKLIKYRQDTVIKKFPAYCKKCKHESLITIEPMSRMIVK